MEKRLLIFFLVSTAVILSVGVANHRLPPWTPWVIAAGAGVRILIQHFIKKKKTDV